ncbi:MAG: MFS transporter [Planctomycetales bacterium]|nr:MFS transporter [Planctomycetales bacterium]
MAPLAQEQPHHHQEGRRDISSTKSAAAHPWRRGLTMASLIVAGEAVFGLPFHITRYFRPTFVDVFGLSQAELGQAQSDYGLVAMVSYLVGGVVADRFPVRWLLTFSLVITGLSGFYLATTPSLAGLRLLYAFWGFSTILPFWAALIKATRQWGGDDSQGIAFGLLDGGRGMFAALLSLVALYFLALHVPAVGDATLAQQAAGLQNVILTYTLACFFAAACVWLFLPHSTSEQEATNTRATASEVIEVLKMPAVWLQAMVIVAAYCMFKGSDYYSQFAKDIWSWNDVEAARLSSLSTFARPVAAIGAGLVADRFSSSRVLIASFLLSGAAYVAMILTPPATGMWLALWASVLPGALGVFAMRGVYFALLEESSIPPRLTGAAVGVVSFIGFTPEVFMPRIAGELLTTWENGPMGYTLLYGLLAVVGVGGVVCSAVLSRRNRGS